MSLSGVFRDKPHTVPDCLGCSDPHPAQGDMQAFPVCYLVMPQNNPLGWEPAHFTDVVIGVPLLSPGMTDMGVFNQQQEGRVHREADFLPWWSLEPVAIGPSSRLFPLGEIGTVPPVQLSPGRTEAAACEQVRLYLVQVGSWTPQGRMGQTGPSPGLSWP